MNSIGPELPPHLRKQLAQSEENGKREVYGPEMPKKNSEIGPKMPENSVKDSYVTDKEQIGPQLPGHLKSRHVHSMERDTGPALPEHLKEKEKESDSSETAIGPALPDHLKCRTHDIGPALPEHLRAKNSASLRPDESGSRKEVGPTEKTGVALDKSEDVFGPSLPPHLLARAESSASKTERTFGPALPAGYSLPTTGSDDEPSEGEDTYGPDLRLMSDNKPGDVALQNWMARNNKKPDKTDSKVEREEWMLELPPEMSANFGLGPRKFRAKNPQPTGDRSIWTDTPNDKERKSKEPPKVDEKEEMRKYLIAKRDEEMEKMARKAEKKLKRKESLLETHEKNLKKAKEAKKAEGQPVYRKMFNREEDMKVNRFDEAQKKAVIKRAQLLDDRFAKGESKFL